MLRVQGDGREGGGEKTELRLQVCTIRSFSFKFQAPAVKARRGRSLNKMLYLCFLVLSIRASLHEQVRIS